MANGYPRHPLGPRGLAVGWYNRGHRSDHHREIKVVEVPLRQMKPMSKQVSTNHLKYIRNKRIIRMYCIVLKNADGEDKKTSAVESNEQKSTAEPNVVDQKGPTSSDETNVIDKKKNEKQKSNQDHYVFLALSSSAVYFMTGPFE
jgi:hypothetical protein